MRRRRSPSRSRSPGSADVPNLQSYIFVYVMYSFGGVLDSFKIVYRDKESILDQIYKKQICSDFYYDNF